MRRFVQAHRLLLAVLVALVAALGVAACGSDDDGGGGSTGGGGSSTTSTGDGGITKGDGVDAGTGDRAETAKKAGEAAAGEPITLEKKTLGLINFLGGIESSDRLKTTTIKAAEQVGWEVKVCDGKGTPTVFVTCGNSLLDQGVDALVEIAIEPGTIQPVLDKAKKSNIPVVQIGGGEIPNGDLSGNWGPNETKAGQTLTDYIMEKIADLPEAGIIYHDFPAKWASARTDTLRDAVKASSNAKFLAETTTDAATLVEFTRKTVGDQITQFPDAKAYWFSFDTTGQVGGQVIQSKYPGKEFPDRPLVATHHADLGTLDLMRKGAVDVVSEANYDAASWIAVDQLAQFFGRQTPISTENQPEYPGVGDMFSYQIVTKENLPPEGEYFPPTVDVVTYFTSKWAKEFGAAS